VKRLNPDFNPVEDLFVAVSINEVTLECRVSIGLVVKQEESEKKVASYGTDWQDLTQKTQIGNEQVEAMLCKMPPATRRSLILPVLEKAENEMVMKFENQQQYDMVRLVSESVELFREQWLLEDEMS
jgi:hypothetical protein